MAITIEPLGPESFRVIVTSEETTTHTVAVPAAYARKLTGGRASTEALIEKSFDFLLQRESNSSILRSFELSVIERYFPGYETALSKEFL